MILGWEGHGLLWKLDWESEDVGCLQVVNVSLSDFFTTTFPFFFFYLDILRHFELIDVVFLCSNAGMGEQGDNVRVFFIPSKSVLSLIPSFLKSNPSA